MHKYNCLLAAFISLFLSCGTTQLQTAQENDIGLEESSAGAGIEDSDPGLKLAIAPATLPGAKDQQAIMQVEFVPGLQAGKVQPMKAVNLASDAAADILTVPTTLEAADFIDNRAQVELVLNQSVLAEQTISISATATDLAGRSSAKVSASLVINELSAVAGYQPLVPVPLPENAVYLALAKNDDPTDNEVWLDLLFNGSARGTCVNSANFHLIYGAGAAGPSLLFLEIIEGSFFNKDGNRPIFLSADLSEQSRLVVGISRVGSDGCVSAYAGAPETIFSLRFVAQDLEQVPLNFSNNSLKDAAANPLNQAQDWYGGSAALQVE